MTRNAKQPGTPTDWYTRDFYNAKLKPWFKRRVSKGRRAAARKQIDESNE